MSKKVDVTLTSNEGCRIRIVGTIDYSIVPPSIDDFHGTITLSGGPNCPKGVLTFDMLIPDGDGMGEEPSNPRSPRATDVRLSANSRNIYLLNKIRFVEGEQEVPHILTSKKVISELMTELASIERDMQRDLGGLCEPARAQVVSLTFNIG